MKISNVILLLFFFYFLVNSTSVKPGGEIKSEHCNTSGFISIPLQQHGTNGLGGEEDHRTQTEATALAHYRP